MSAERRRFPLAPMDGLNWALTVVALVLPLALLLPITIFLATGPTQVRVGLFVVGPVLALILVLYAVILSYARPRCFELSDAGLEVVWPVRRRLIPRAELAGAELLTRAELRARYGRGARVGAGGLGGGFGWLLTPKQRFHLYISRVDRLVVLQLRGGLPWLITPASPEAFVSAVRALVASPLA